MNEFRLSSEWRITNYPRRALCLLPLWLASICADYQLQHLASLAFLAQTFDRVLAYDTRITFKITGSVANLKTMYTLCLFLLSLT